MVKDRIEKDDKAAELMGVLKTRAFEDIASNPLMLSMILSVYIKKSYDISVVSNRAKIYERTLQDLMEGSDVCFAPVLDINTNPKNPIIGNRSYGENKINVSKKGISFTKVLS